VITHRPGLQTPPDEPGVPPLDDETEGLFDDLQGFGPGIDQILDGLRHIALTAHSSDSTQTHLAVLAGTAPNITELLARIITRLGDPSSNPALRDLTPEQQDTVRDYTAQYALYDEQFAPRQLVAEATAVIDGR
jgi:streptomycin 6-kinase